MAPTRLGSAADGAGRRKAASRAARAAYSLLAGLAVRHELAGMAEEGRIGGGAGTRL